MPNQAPFPIDPQLTAIAVAYRNPSMNYIADQVLPRVPVGREDFKYWSYPVEETFRLPDTRVGRRGRPNEVVVSATETTASTTDYGLEHPLPQSDIDQAPVGYDPRGNAVEQLTDYIMIDREKRAADLVFTAANYPAGNKVTLSGTSQFSHVSSTPIDTINAGIVACLVKPNVLTLGRDTWLKLRTHAEIVKAVSRSSGDKGMVSRQEFAELFELEEVLVGESLLNTAKLGQAATLSTVWGKHAALQYRNRLASTTGGLTFGFTAQFGSRISGSRPDPDIGLRGGQRVRVGESVGELIVASRVGYLFENAVA
jgi:hypothetical protein